MRPDLYHRTLNSQSLGHRIGSMIDKKWTFIFVAWIVSSISTAGSLFFSNVMMLPPCVLCWYQRICMYPLVILFLTGLISFDRSIVKFAAPLAISGWLLAFYHNLLYYKFLPESASPCIRGISCTAVQINWLGLITIPLMSLVAFTIILILLFMTQRILHREK
jgi:disulfide bond formation protein DsbB